MRKVNGDRDGPVRFWYLGADVTGQPLFARSGDALTGVTYGVSASAPRPNVAASGSGRKLTAAEEKLYGPVSRPKGFKEKVWELNKGPDGLVRDPSGKVLKFNEPWELGHMPGSKATDARIWAAEQGMDRATWIKFQNHCRPIAG